MLFSVNHSGTDLSLITVITQTDQTPRGPATLAAAQSEKPARKNVTFTVVDGGHYANVFPNFTDYTQIEATLANYIALNQWEPPSTSEDVIVATTTRRYLFPVVSDPADVPCEVKALPVAVNNSSGIARPILIRRSMP